MPAILTRTAVALYITALVTLVGIGNVFHAGSYERLTAVIARAAFNARYAHFVQTGAPARLEEQTEERVIRAQGMGVVRRIHTARSIRAKSGFFFSLVTEPGQPGPAPMKSSVVDFGPGLGPATRRVLNDGR